VGIVPAALLLSGLLAVWAGPLPAVAGTAPTGPVVAWGSNDYGESAVPTGLAGVTAIAAGSSHSVALKSNGTVFAWGYNGSGQTTIPTGLSGVTAIAAGDSHSLALKSNGTVVAWGNNYSGQTTVPAPLQSPTTAHVTAIAAGGYHSLALRADGTLVAWGDNFNGQTTVPAAASSGVIAIAAGGYHSLALKSNGTIVAWGNNYSGQTTIPAAASSGVIAIAAGGYHSLALKSNGTVVAWGSNDFGQTTVPATALSGVIAIAGGGYHSLALKSNGTLVAWGDNFNGQTTVPAGLTGVTAIAAGGYHSLALVSPPHLTVSGIVSPYAAGSAHSVTVTAKDAYGNTATGYRGTVHFTSSDAHAVLPANYTFTAGDAGVHKFSLGLTLKTAGTQGVRATDTVSATITGAQHGIVVTPAAATTLVVSGLASPRTAGVAGTITVNAKDAYGNTATGYRGTVHFTSSDSHAVLPANYTFIGANSGTHTFSVTLKSAGTQAVRARDTVTPTITGVQSGIVVTPAAATTLVVSGLASPRTAGVAGTVTVTAKDAYGNTATGYRGTVHFTSSDSHAVLPTNYTFTAANAGTHTFSVTLKTVGTQAVRARDTVTATITGLESGIVVT